jgi:Na+-driven multidrug efflux pump
LIPKQNDKKDFHVRDSFDGKFRHRSYKVLKLAIPAMIAIIITFGYVLVNIAFAGKLQDPRALAGIGLSNVLINGLWFTTFNGFSGALQTLVS